MTRMTMVCGHCLRRVWGLHAGSGGPGLCCECVHVHRMWLALEKRAVGQHNQYAEEALAEHRDGWCMGPESGVSAADFERQYAERSGVSVEWLRAHGRVVQPCECGEDDCVGWQSVNGADWAFDQRLLLDSPSDNPSERWIGDPDRAH